MEQRVSFITLAVENVARSRAFYVDGLGWTPRFEAEDVVMLPAGEHRLDSFDKQIVRDWLAANWDKQGTPPPLPAEIVERTAARYRELIERLTA